MRGIGRGQRSSDADQLHFSLICVQTANHEGKQKCLEYIILYLLVVDFQESSFMGEKVFYLETHIYYDYNFEGTGAFGQQ